MEFTASVERMLADVSPLQLPIAVDEDEVNLTNLTTFKNESPSEDQISFVKESFVSELGRHANILDVAKGMSKKMESEYGGIW